MDIMTKTEMRTNQNRVNCKWKQLSFTILMLVNNSCVDRLDIEANTFDKSSSQIVIDGYISDQPGPYYVKIFKPSAVDDVLNAREGLQAKQVLIFDDAGNQERLEGERGLYYTNPLGMQGVVGRKYWLEVELLDGRLFKSRPEEIQPSGTIDSIYVEFDSYKPLRGPTQYFFRVFIDATAGLNSYIRWRDTGIFYIETLQGGCYPSIYEQGAQVSDGQFVQGGKFKSILVGAVYINQYTFYSKYMVRVEQMSLNKEAFDFWKIAADQFNSKESLFQPSFGSLPKNIYEVNTNEPALGFFYAASIVRKNIFLTRDDVPVPVPPYTLEINAPCVNVFSNATPIKPFDWN